LPAPTMSHIICTTALIILIFTMQFFYMYVIDNIWAEMARRELKEVADYVSDTLANLYFLANSTSDDVTLEKTLSLPPDIRDSTYVVKVENNTEGFAQSISTHLMSKSWINATSWILPGLMVNGSACETVESGGKTVVACCSRVSMNVYVWIAYGGA